jgi:hypothetical protein
MGLLKYIVSLPSHQRASIIASMLANIPTITCCCDDVLPTEPHIESQSQYLSTIVSACGAYATLSACVDCITQAACITLVNIIVICSALVAYSAAACLALLILLLPLVPLVPLASFVCVTPRRCCRCGARAACAVLAPHFSRPCYRLCHLRRLRHRDACGAAWQPSLPRSRGPQRPHCLRHGFRLRCVRRCAAAACIISQCASPNPRWNGGCVLVCMEARTRALTNRV